MEVSMKKKPRRGTRLETLNPTSSRERFSAASRNKEENKCKSTLKNENNKEEEEQVVDPFTNTNQ